MSHEYRSPFGVRFSFSGWKPEDKPLACFDRKDYLACMHGCMLALTLLDTPEASHRCIADDGMLHELLHLASGIDICTHHPMSRIRAFVVYLESAIEVSYVQVHAEVR